jgi:ABC-type transport system substrate-binding protein
VLISDLQAIGFKVQTTGYDSAAYFPAVENPAATDIAANGAASLLPDPQIPLDVTSIDNIAPNGSKLNLAFFNDRQYNLAVQAARTEVDPVKRETLLQKAIFILRQRAPIIWAMRSNSNVAFNPKKVAAQPQLLSGNVDVLGTKFP